MVQARVIWLVALLGLAACAIPGRAPAPPAPVATPIAVTTQQRPLAPLAGCDGRFVAHKLDVATGVRTREIRTYLSNGAGLAAGDLDNDGDLDLAFASVDDTSTILWNEGQLAFTAEPIADSFTRAVSIVDVDGDGWLDLAFTHRGVEGVSFWHNRGAGAGTSRFTREPLPGVEHYAYSMAWADLNGDGTLDLVTGAYDVELKSHGIAEQDIRTRGGVVLYEQRNGKFSARQLTDRSETLTIGLVDLDGDGQLDIWAANDFALPDGHWLRRAGGWAAAQPFGETSHSTMSIDWGDLTNDGRMAMFSTDMNPGELEPTILASWLPVISKLEEKHGPSDPQIMANTLQIPAAVGGWRNEAARRGVDATGWSWSGKFGDLDNDGHLDLYIVNGMIAENLFGHLPGAELVEENRAFRNRGDGSFQAAPEWRLGAQTSGRGMLMADFDNDGDLDIAVNNLRSQAQLFENRLCGGDGLEVEINWSASPNSHAIGTQLELYTSAGVLHRDLRTASGYLSGDPARAHFGLPTGIELRKLIVRFPDGATAEIDALRPHILLEVTR